MALRGDLKEANEGRQKAEVEAPQLRVEVEALRRTRNDLQQRLGVAEAQLRVEAEAMRRTRDDLQQRVTEAQVRSLNSTLSATYTAQ